MSKSVGDLPLKTLNGAERQYVETHGSALVLNTYLKAALGVALLAICVLSGGLWAVQAQASHVKPIIIRIDELGRPDVVPYDVATTYTPRPNELRSALHNFIRRHYSRRHGAVTQDFTESLFFLNPKLGESQERADNQALVKFLNNPAAEEIDVEVKNVKMLELGTPPFKAQVDFEKHFYQPGTRQQQKPIETYSAQLEFIVRDSVPAAFIPVNPLGLQITFLHLDEAFK